MRVSTRLLLYDEGRPFTSSFRKPRKHAPPLTSPGTATSLVILLVVVGFHFGLGLFDNFLDTSNFGPRDQGFDLVTRKSPRLIKQDAGHGQGQQKGHDKVLIKGNDAIRFSQGFQIPHVETDRTTGNGENDKHHDSTRKGQARFCGGVGLVA